MDTRKTILLIDDDNAMHVLAKTFLEKSGYRYIAAFNGGKGLKKIVEEKPDLILLDYMMPGLDGGQVYAELMSNEYYRPYRDIPVIMLTARDDDPCARLKFLEGGISAYLIKPFGLRELKNVIENVFISKEIQRKNRQLQREIEQTKEYLELLLNNTPIGIFSADSKGCIIKANSALCEILKVNSPEYFLGRNIAEEGFVGCRDLSTKFKATLEEGKYFKIDSLDYTTVSGNRIKLNLRCVPLKDSNGNVSGLISIVQDVTETDRKSHELSLLNQISQAMQGTLDLDQLLHLILTCITAGVAMGFSRAMIFLINHKEKVLEGRMGVGPVSREDAHRIWHELAREQLPLPDFLEKYGQRVIDEGDYFNRMVQQIRIPLNEEKCIIVRTVREKRAFKVVHGDGRIKFCPEVFRQMEVNEFVSIPLIARDKVIGAIMADNLYSGEPIDENLQEFLTLFANQAALAVERAETYLKLEEEKNKLERAYEELRTTQDRLLHSERLATIGKVAAQVAHEIRNPLATIGGFARSILKWNEEKSIEDLKIVANIIAEEVERLENILTNVLDFTRLTRPNLVEEDINKLVQEACFFVIARDEMSRRKISIHKNLDLTLPKVWVDPQQIKQVLLNILENAVYSMSDGGKLEITTKRNSKKWIEVEIKDTGQGIPPEVLENMFNPFFTTKPDGTGLGLPISQQIINSHGGQINVTSDVGIGTTFSFTLPILSAPGKTIV